MSEEDDKYGNLLDQLIGGHFTMQVFMLELSVQLARTQSHPEQWASGFISSLHARIDGNENRIGAAARELPSHEMARQNFDLLGKDLLQELKRPS
jgi:hypothetical protein